MVYTVTEFACRAGSMRDYTRILEDEVIPVLKAQSNTYQELAQEIYRIFTSLNEAHTSLN